mmetsp:Transcript_19725/g.32966  ORF Transcript_19725/g.32966 Transcript_19725/m.32966 type:complete len:1119 (+) Transcript_19725:127-3483(+)
MKFALNCSTLLHATILLVACVIPLKATTQTLSECQKRLSSSFTASQKQQLCAETTHNDIGPAMCAAAAKQLLNMNFDNTLQLCLGAESAAPAQCMSKMNKNQRAKNGISLCKGAKSTLPGTCYNEISGYPGTKNQVKPELLEDFCLSLEDEAPLLCIRAVKDTSLMPVTQAIEVCAVSVGSAGVERKNAGTRNVGNTFARAHEFFLSLIGMKRNKRGNTHSDAAVANCIQAMKDEVKPSFGVIAMEVLRFCVNSNPSVYDFFLPRQHPSSVVSPPATCFQLSEQLKQSANSGNNAFNPKQRLGLCSNAYVADGPINCTAHILSHASLSSEIKAPEVVSLCQGARSAGPAECFLESKGLGATTERVNLCNGAEGAGPARCYRRSMNTFRADVGNRTFLCTGADAEDPAICAVAAPNYLAMTEKVELCTHAPPFRAQEGVKCLSAVESASKRFRHAPKKGLGYFRDDLWDARDQQSRALLIAMCSFSFSQTPLASAECFKSAPNSLAHDDAARMCTNISSTDVIEHMQLCYRLLPKDWRVFDVTPAPTTTTTAHEQQQQQQEEDDREAAALLCGQSDSRTQVEAALKCAAEASRLAFPKLSRLELAPLCGLETSQGTVLKCLQQVSKISPASPGAYLLTPEVIVATCMLSGRPATATTTASTSSEKRDTRSSGSGSSRSAGTDTGSSRGSGSTGGTASGGSHMTLLPAQCLSNLVAASTSRLVYDASVPPYLCALKEPMPVVKCLENLHKKMIAIEDVDFCANTKQEVKTMRVKRIHTQENGIDIIAGQRFSLWLELLDQFGRAFEDPLQEYMFSASLNSNNPQGATLWGLRSNYSTAGVLQLDYLVISQPGPVELKISVRDSSSSSGGSMETASSVSSSVLVKLVEVFHLNVQEDPVIANAAPCIYVLKDSMCPADTLGSDWDADFPRVRSYSSGTKNNNYLRNIVCAGEALSAWHVDSHLNADGSLWIDFRMGVDSIWTGVGMPRMEQSPEERLGLFSEEGVVSGFKSNVRTDMDSSSSSSSNGDSSNSTSNSRSGRAIDKKKAARAAQKAIRRAYYRKSLQWHPDRWAGLPMYALAVQGAFELITEAYQRLTGEGEGEEEGDSSTSGSTSTSTSKHQ